MEQKLWWDILLLLGIYTMCVCGHFLATHLYTSFCTPWTWTGFFFSPLRSLSPECRALRWIIMEGSGHMESVSYGVAGWCIARFFSYTKHRQGASSEPAPTTIPTTIPLEVSPKTE
jgi:hypothetical protein